jgi:hypothetical protein
MVSEVRVAADICARGDSSVEAARAAGCAAATHRLGGLALLEHEGPGAVQQRQVRHQRRVLPRTPASLKATARPPKQRAQARAYRVLEDLQQLRGVVRGRAGAQLDAVGLRFVVCLLHRPGLSHAALVQVGRVKQLHGAVCMSCSLLPCVSELPHLGDNVGDAPPGAAAILSLATPIRR